MIEKNTISCPNCREKINSLIYCQDEGWQDIEYLIKNGKLDMKNYKKKKGEFLTSWWECPKCGKRMSQDEIKKMGLL